MNKTLTCLLALVCGAIMAAEQLTVKNYSFTQVTDAEAPRQADAEFTKLTDGKYNVDGQKATAGTVKWRHKNNQGKAPVITFNFNNPVKLDKVGVRYYRWKKSHGIKDIKVIGITPYGKRVELGKVVLNHPFEKAEADPYNALVEIKCSAEQTITAAEVAFTATGGWLVLNEVEFFGENIQLTAEEQAAIKRAASIVKLPVQSYSFKEKTDADSDKNADPGFYKLTDGKKNQDGQRETAGRVKWRHKNNQRKAPTITFNFKNPVKLDRVNVHYYRWKRSHGIKDITLVGYTADGKKLPLGKLTLNHPFEKPASDPDNADAEIKVVDDSAVVSVEVIFTATGGFLSLDEVEFFGEAAKADPQAAKAEANPMEKYASAGGNFRCYQDSVFF